MKVLKHVFYRMRSALERFRRKQGGFGMNEVLGVAAGLIIAAFIIIPGLRRVADSIIDRLEDWWLTNIAGQIFTNSPNP